jgi:2-polyprenyl-3-methyl-5-hydroxy-6-metoxy-1,4-benzoquinol methylase
MSIEKTYTSINVPVLRCVPQDASRVLDLGCGTGAFAAELKKRSSLELVGVTYSSVEGQEASQCMDRVVVADLNTFDFSDLGTFDCVVMSHVLEHLYDPAGLLVRLKAALSPGAIVIIALPNILAWRQRIQFLLGRFRYADYGPMDRTHFRFFDAVTATQLLRDGGYELVRTAHAGHFPQPGLRRLSGAMSRAVDRLATRNMPGLFADQFILVARAGPIHKT